MKKKVFLSAAMLGISILALGSVSLAAEQAEKLPAGVFVEESEDSATGYTITFRYYDENATNVQVAGGFHFYEENADYAYGYGVDLAEGDSTDAHLFTPDTWSKDANLYHVNDQACILDMEKDENGAWTYTVDLTGGWYLYQYNVSYNDGACYTSISDPGNLPGCNSLGGQQVRSRFYVPYNAEKQAPQDDWTYTTPAENEADRGTLYHMSYLSADGVVRPVRIHLPAGYDADRAEAYKVLYLSHGGGGDEADWDYQGHAGDIADRLTAEGVCEPFIIVMMNNSQFGWDYDAIYDNTKNYLIPYMEENYNVVTDASGRAFAGLSMGGMTTSELLFRDQELFGYYGIMSGSAAFDLPQQDDYSSYNTPNLYLAAGWADMALKNDSYQTDKDRTSIGLAEKFDELGIAYNNGTKGVYIVQGGHDWFTWPQILKNYIETTLWK